MKGEPVTENPDDLWPYEDTIKSQESQMLDDLWPVEQEPLPALDPRWVRWHFAIDDPSWNGDRERGAPCKVCGALYCWKDADGAYRHPCCGEPGPADFLPATWGEEPIRSGFGGVCSICQNVDRRLESTIMLPLGRYAWACVCIRCASTPTPPAFTHAPAGPRATPRKPEAGKPTASDPIFLLPGVGNPAEHEATIKAWMRHAGVWPYEVLDMAHSATDPGIGPALAGLAASKKIKPGADGLIKITEGLVEFILMGIGARAHNSLRGKFYYFPKPREKPEDLWPI